MEAIELHTLERRIKLSGGVILDRNTDAIRYSCNEELSTDNFYWDKEQTVLKYQREDPKALEKEILPQMVRQPVVDFSVFDLQWNVTR